MTGSSSTVTGSLQEDLQQLWSCLDMLLQVLEPARSDAGGTALSSVGPLEVPGHVAWFDSALVLNAIRRGAAVPTVEQRTITSLAELERWEPWRDRGRLSWDDDVARMRATREALSMILAGGHEQPNLAERVWWPLPLSGGWRTVRFALEACSSHTWNHVLELWTVAHGRGAPLTSIALSTHRALARYTRMMIALLDRNRAMRTPPLTAIMVFTGPGGGAWTFRVASGTCRVTEEMAPHADVVITQSPETFLRTMVLGTESQLMAVLAGEIRVQGSVWAAAAFRHLFPRPRHYQKLSSRRLAAVEVG